MKSKNKLFSLSSILIALALVLIGCSGSNESNGTAGGEEKVYQFDFNNINPANGSLSVNVMEPWAELVEEKTNGRVKINIHHGGALGKIETVFDDVKGGVYDMGELYTQELEDTNNHALSVGDLPFTVTNDLEVDSKVMQEYYDIHKDTILQDIELLTIWAAPYTNVFSSVPIESVDDLKGLKIRAGSQSEASIYQDWGMVPVEVAGAERYDALQKGIIDVAGTANFVGTQNHFYEVAPYYVELPYKTMHAMLIMNKGSFNKLPDDLKEIFRNELIPAYSELSTKTNIEDTTNALEEIKEKVDGKGSVTTFPEAELEKLKAMTVSAEEAWVKNANERDLDGEKLIQQFKEIQEKVLAEKNQ